MNATDRTFIEHTIVTLYDEVVAEAGSAGLSVEEAKARIRPQVAALVRSLTDEGVGA